MRLREVADVLQSSSLDHRDKSVFAVRLILSKERAIGLQHNLNKCGVFVFRVEMDESYPV